MAGAASWAVPAVLGGIGLMQNASAQRTQQSDVNRALQAQQPQIDAEKAQLALAQGYNPQQEDARAITAADQNASQLVNRDLGTLAGQWTSGGGSPTGDTGFAVGATNAANRTLDPLRQYAASLAATETQRKA